MKRFAAAVLASLVLGPPAAALEREPVRLWMGVNFGLGTYAMADVNNYLNAVNDVAGLSLPPLSRGYSVSLEVGGQVTTALSLSAGYQRLTASSEQSTTTMDVTESFAADVILGTARYLLRRTPHGGLGFSAGVGELSTKGNSRVFGGEITGRGLYLEGAGIAEYATATPLVFTMSVGYRLAETTDFRIDGVSTQVHGVTATIDYSGLTAQAGIRLNLF